MPSAKWRPSCLSLNVLNLPSTILKSQRQYNVTLCRSPGNAGSQGISCYGIGLVWLEYSEFDKDQCNEA